MRDRRAADVGHQVELSPSRLCEMKFLGLFDIISALYLPLRTTTTLVLTTFGYLIEVISVEELAPCCQLCAYTRREQSGIECANYFESSVSPGVQGTNCAGITMLTLGKTATALGGECKVCGFDGIEK